MPFLHNIRTVALYEAKTMRRSWFFRLFSIGALVILTFLNIGLFSPIGDEPWEMTALPSTVPLINLYLLNIGQALVVIFLAADFLKRDKKLDTNEVLYTRSMSNFEYIIGKTTGILRLFLGLNILILCIALLVNIISVSMSVDIMSYLIYILFFSLPTLVFSLGLAFMLMQVIRNQAITFMLLLGYAALDMFYLYFRAGSLFDYMAFGLPLFKSGMIGFDNPWFILNHRLLYFFLGMAMVMGTVLLFRRLPQSRLHTGITIVLLGAFILGATYTGLNVWSSHKGEINDRLTVIETNKNFESNAFPTITEARIDFEHKGDSLQASADIRIRNENKEPLKEYLFSLNPSLTITKVTSGNLEFSFRRANHIIEIDPGKYLEKNQTDSMKIFYSGTINEPYCYPDHSGSLKDNSYRSEMLNINKRQTFLTRDYVLLTPEAHWYPVAGLNYYPSNPARLKIDFTRYTLNVLTRDGLSAVSQGIPSGGDGHYTFSPDLPLTGLTLAVGNYRMDTLKVDSVTFLSYHFPGNDYYKKDLSELKDTLGSLVSAVMRELETNFSVKYPFSTLSILEVPVQFYSLPKRSTQTRAEVQPSMVLVPERFVTVRDGGFYKRFKSQKKRMAREGQVITDKELQVRLFNSFIRNTFINGENFRYQNGVAWNEPTRYRLGPSFYFFRNNFTSEEYPVLNAVFETHLQKVTNPASDGFGLTNIFGNLSDIDKANLYLHEKSFRELLADNPAGDTVNTVLTLKGDYLFNLLRSKAGITEFNSWLSDYLNANKFRSIDITMMNDEVGKRFGFEFYSYLNDWFYTKEQPGFIFTKLQAREIVTEDRVRYQVTFIASNPESVSGLFNVEVGTGGENEGGTRSMITEGPRGPGFTIAIQGRGMEPTNISKIVVLGPGESKRIGIVMDSPPREVRINTLVSKNIPGVITLPFGEIIKSKERSTGFSGEESVQLLINEASEIIVDNEDPGFQNSNKVVVSPLKKILGVRVKMGDNYEDLRMYNVPEYWQPVVKSEYFGKYVLSSVYTRAGTGERTVSWQTPVIKAGYYDVYCYVGKPADNIRIGEEGSGFDFNEQRGKSPYQDMHYRIYHDDGVDEITVEYENAENGWNNLGRYHLSADTARVELTNKSEGRVVIGDAVKWVLRD